MSHSLDGARLKIVWAQKHLDTLENNIARYLKGDIHKVTVENYGNLTGVLTEVTKHPEAEFGCIIGDCLTNSRAALDYVIWELAGVFCRRKLIGPPIGKDRPHFPIDITAKWFAESLNRLKQYKISAAAIADIEAVQPYHALYSPLWTLDTLVNIEKHRLPLVAIGKISGGEFVIHLPADNPAFQTDSIPLPVAGVDDMQVNGQATAFVAWKDVGMPWEPVGTTLANIIKCVANVIPRFEGYM